MIVRINYSGQLEGIIITRKLDDWNQQSALVIREPCLSDLLRFSSFININYKTLPSLLGWYQLLVIMSR